MPVPSVRPMHRMPLPALPLCLVGPQGAEMVTQGEWLLQAPPRLGGQGTGRGCRGLKSTGTEAAGVFIALGMVSSPRNPESSPWRPCPGAARPQYSGPSWRASGCRYCRSAGHLQGGEIILHSQADIAARLVPLGVGPGLWLMLEGQPLPRPQRPPLRPSRCAN